MSSQKDTKQKTGLSPLRSPKCCRCRNHGIISAVRGHKRYCQWKDCNCDSCMLLMKRQQNSKEQIALRRLWRQEEDMGLVTPVPNSGSLQILIQRYPHHDVDKLNSILKCCEDDTDTAMERIDAAMNKALDAVVDTKPDPSTVSPPEDARFTQGGMGFLGFQGYNHGYHSSLPTPHHNITCSPLSPRGHIPIYPRTPFMYPYSPPPRFFQASPPDVTYTGDFHASHPSHPSVPIMRPSHPPHDFPTPQPRNMFFPDSQGAVESMIGYPKSSAVNTYQARHSPVTPEERPLVIDLKDEDGTEGLLPNYTTQ